jgi:hypothetical protein
VLSFHTSAYKEPPTQHWPFQWRKEHNKGQWGGQAKQLAQAIQPTGLHYVRRVSALRGCAYVILAQYPHRRQLDGTPGRRKK